MDSLRTMWAFIRAVNGLKLSEQQYDRLWGLVHHIPGQPERRPWWFLRPFIRNTKG